MNLKELEEGLLKYKEKEFINFIKVNFMDEQFINKATLTANHYLLNLINESVRNHTVAKLDTIIEDYANDTQLYTNVTFSLTILSLMFNVLDGETNSNNYIGVILGIILVVSFVLLAFIIMKKRNKNVAVYFKSLLNNL